MARAASEQQQRKLWLVLDLDQTLLHTGKLANLSLLDLLSIEELADYETQLFAPSSSTLTKLRPFAHAFLRETSRMFHLCVCTMGTRNYAQQMLSMLDPGGLLLKGCPMLCRENMVVCDGGKRKKFLDEFPSVPPHLSQVLILDDTPDVWPHHKYGANLIVIDRYTFFPSDRHSYTGSDVLLRSSSTSLDESAADGPLANVLVLLRQIHRAFSLNPLFDARQLLRSCCTGSVGKGYRLLASPLANQAPVSFSSSSFAEPEFEDARPCKKQRLQDGWAKPMRNSHRLLLSS